LSNSIFAHSAFNSLRIIKSRSIVSTGTFLSMAFAINASASCLTAMMAASCFF
jgi:hypothetical protein